MALSTYRIPFVNEDHYDAKGEFHPRNHCLAEHLDRAMAYIWEAYTIMSDKDCSDELWVMTNRLADMRDNARSVAASDRAVMNKPAATVQQ